MKEFFRHRRIRAGGNVKRFHCFPLIGEQTIAAHSWGVAAILIEICRPSAAMLQAAIYHDIAEYDTGDTPSSAKVKCPELKKLLDKIEEGVFAWLDINIALSDYDKNLLKIADLMEMLFFIYEQRVLGSKAMDGVFPRVVHWLRTRNHIPEHAVSLINQVTLAYEELDNGSHVVQDHGNSG